MVLIEVLVAVVGVQTKTRRNNKTTRFYISTVLKSRKASLNTISSRIRDAVSDEMTDVFPRDNECPD